MEETFIERKKKEEEVDSQCSLSKDIGVTENNLEITEQPKRKSWLERVKAQQIIASETKQQLAAARCIQASFLDPRIPQNLCFVGLDDKHLQRCLSVVELGASNSLSIVCSPVVLRNNAVILRSSNVIILVDELEIHEIRRNTRDSSNFLIQSSSVAGPGYWILSRGEGNEDARNNFKVQLLGHLGSLGGGTPNIGILGSINSSDFMKSPSGISISSPQKLETVTTPTTSEQYGSESLHERGVSISTSSSTCSYKSSSAPVTVYQGVLRCEWKSGTPYFVYSVDDQKEVYIANLLKVESSVYKDLDHVYLFRSNKDCQKERGTCDNASEVVAKMKVSSSIAICSNDSKIMETEFVLFGADAKHSGNAQDSDLIVGKKKGPQKKTAISSTKHFFKHISFPRYDEQSSIHEVPSCHPGKDTLNNLGILGGVNLLESPPNLELAAIIVKEHLHDDHQKAVVGGWGLKFLEKGRAGCASSSSQETSVSPGSFQDQSDCSTSVNVLIPAGFHGGPRTRSGGPSSLTERWRSGGHCDCGGWDICCPITVLNNKSSEELWTHADPEGESKSLELVIEGAEEGVVPLKMVNIQDGVYRIHFQASVSALQSFSIGLAVIHTQSPTLRLKNIHNLKLQG